MRGWCFMKWFKQEDLKDVNTLRIAYKKLLIKYHPDNNKEDTTVQMQEINAEYDRLFERIKCAYESSESYEKQTDRQKQAYDFEKDQKIKDIISALCRFAKFDIQIEIIGTWIWVTGNTKPYKEQLKQLNLHYAKNKKAWYIHFDDGYKGNRHTVSMSFIRDKYGSVIIKKEDKEENRRLQQC